MHGFHFPHSSSAFGLLSVFLRGLCFVLEFHLARLPGQHTSLWGLMCAGPALGTHLFPRSVPTAGLCRAAMGRTPSPPGALHVGSRGHGLPPAPGVCRFWLPTVPGAAAEAVSLSLCVGQSVSLGRCFLPRRLQKALGCLEPGFASLLPALFTGRHCSRWAVLAMGWVLAGVQHGPGPA